MDPKLVMISVNGDDGIGLPESKVLDALHQRNSNPHRTDCMEILNWYQMVNLLI